MISGSTARVVYRYCHSAVLAAMGAWVLSGCNGLGSSSTVGAPDTTPPTAPAGLTATATLATQINLSWTASTDNVGVTGYKLERCSGAGCANFAQVATPTLTAFNDSGLTASTSYSYRVRASDAAGNDSG
jgi:predicted phage tail protein